jgi:DNA repair exonuclease SbcCD ATPase subunit
MDTFNEHHCIAAGGDDASISDLTLAYMKTVSTRLDRTETEFVDHLRKVESRLDQLVDLMRDVAALQQQYTLQGEAISELRSTIREQTQRVEGSIARMHQRLDDLNETFTTSIETETGKLNEKLSDQERNHKDLDQRFQMWLNRGLGGWAVMVLILGFLQYAGIRWLDSLDADRTATTERIQKLTSRVSDLENRLLQYEGSPPSRGR